MKKNVRDIVCALGYIPGELENDPEFSLLEELLSPLGPENILSTEEMEMLEIVELTGMREDKMLEMLEEQGIYREALDVDESDVEYLENKLRLLESDVWSCEIDKLQNLHDQMEKIVKELKEKSCEELLSHCVRECENEWEKIDSTFDVLFQNLKEIESCTRNPENEEIFRSFLHSSKMEAEKFSELSSQCINKVLEVNLNNEENMEIANKSSFDLKKEFQENEIFKKLSTLQSRLASCFYRTNLNCAKNEEHCIDTEILQASIKNPSEFPSVFASNINYLNSMASLCEKWTNLQIKKQIILPRFEENRKFRESILKYFNDIKSVLQKQREHNDLVSIVITIWKKDCNVIPELLCLCQEHCEQELENVVTRVKYLEDVAREFKSFFESGDCHNFMLLQKLEKLSNKFCPRGQNTCVRDAVGMMESTLSSKLSDQRDTLLKSKENLINIDKHIVNLQQNMSHKLKIMSEVQEGYRESLTQLQLKEQERKEIADLLIEHPTYRKKRLMWVYFLSDPKKLHEMKEENNKEKLPVTPCFMKEKIFTSTPKEDEG